MNKIRDGGIYLELFTREAEQQAVQNSGQTCDGIWE